MRAIDYFKRPYFETMRSADEKAAELSVLRNKAWAMETDAFDEDRIKSVVADLTNRINQLSMISMQLFSASQSDGSLFIKALGEENEDERVKIENDAKKFCQMKRDVIKILAQ